MDYQKVTKQSLQVSLLWAGMAYLIPFFFLGFFVGPHDFDHLSAYYELAWKYLASFDGLPQFNPYFCGGRTLGGDPQIPIFNPLTLLVPLVGAPWLVRLEMLFQLIVGTYGLIGMGRYFGWSGLQVRWAMLLFATGGAVSMKFLVGHVTLGFFFLFPLFFHLSYQLPLVKGLRFKKLLLVYFFLFIYAGLYKPNFYIYAIPLLLIEHLVRSLLLKNMKPVAFLILACAVSALANAMYLLPSWSYFSSFPRPSWETSNHFTPWYTFFLSLIVPPKSLPSSMYGTSFMQRHEYALFLGPFVLAMACGGMKLFSRKFKAHFIALASLFFFSLLMGMGEDATTSFMPLAWLKGLWPGMDSVRVPVRFWFGAYFSLIVAATFGLKTPKKHAQLVFWLLLTLLPLLVSSSVNLGRSVVENRGIQSAPKPQKRDTKIWTALPATDQYPATRQDLGSLHCIDNVPAFPSPLVTTGALSDVQTQGKVVVEAQLVGWSQFKVRAQGEIGSRFSLNVNGSPLWQASTPGARVDFENKKRLEVVLTQKQWSGTIDYVQPYVKEGVAVSLLTLSLLVVATLGVVRQQNAALRSMKEHR